MIVYCHVMNDDWQFFIYDHILPCNGWGFTALLLVCSIWFPTAINFKQNIVEMWLHYEYMEPHPQYFYAELAVVHNKQQVPTLCKAVSKWSCICGGRGNTWVLGGIWILPSSRNTWITSNYIELALQYSIKSSILWTLGSMIMGSEGDWNINRKATPYAWWC